MQGTLTLVQSLSDPPLLLPLSVMQGKHSASKALSLYALPEILTLHIKVPFPLFLR